MAHSQASVYPLLLLGLLFGLVMCAQTPVKLKAKCPKDCLCDPGSSICSACIDPLMTLESNCKQCSPAAFKASAGGCTVNAVCPDGCGCNDPNDSTLCTDCLLPGFDPASNCVSCKLGYNLNTKPDGTTECLQGCPPSCLACMNGMCMTCKINSYLYMGQCICSVCFVMDSTQGCVCGNPSCC